MTAAIIEARDLVKRFDGFTAVDHISFAVEAGVIFGFLGPNGAGKTTTIKMLTTVLTPSEGRLSIAGHDPVKEPLLVRHAFGIVFQDPSLDDQLTAAENMELHGVLYGVPRVERRERVEALLRFVGLWERRGDYVQFLAPGIVTMGILFTAVFSGIEIIWDRQFGFLKETLVAPVSRLKIVLGQTLGRATVALIQGSIVFLVCLAAGFRPAQPLLLPLALLFMALIAIMCTAIGTAVGSVLQDMQGFQLIINFIVLPLFLFSSALFPVPDLPGAMRVVVRLNPLSYGVDGLRGVLTSGFVFGVATDFAVLGGLAAILLA